MFQCHLKRIYKMLFVLNQIEFRKNMDVQVTELLLIIFGYLDTAFNFNTRYSFAKY